jgi:hypothetical protein
MAQVIANQQTTNNSPITNFGQPGYGAIGGQISTMPMQPALRPKTRPGETLAIIGLIISVVGLVLCLFLGIVGLVFGIAGMVLGTISRSKYKHTMSLLAIIFSGLAIALAIGVTVLAAEKVINKTTLSSNSGSSTGLASISSPCFTTQIDSGLRSTGKVSGACSMDYASRSEEFTIVAEDAPNVTASNFTSIATSELNKAVSKENGTVTSQQSVTFNGSPAYMVVATLPSEQYGVFEYVIHSTPNGDNVFFIGRVVLGNPSVALGPIEEYWQWK